MGLAGYTVQEQVYIKQQAFSDAMCHMRYLPHAVIGLKIAFKVHHDGKVI